MSTGAGPGTLREKGLLLDRSRANWFGVGAVAGQSIAELLRVPPREQDLDWLQTSLQSAVELELSTIPVYLSGMWSIKDGSGAAYNLINSVVLEEMLHLGLACNMLVAIGGKPAITAPTYPTTGLPGGVLPELEVYLAGLSSETVQMYMAIEQPEHPVEHQDPQPDDPPTIGEFYDAIAAAFAALQPSIATEGQIATSLGVPDPDQPEQPSPPNVTEDLVTVASVADVQAAITLIKDQGEGTSTSPDAPQYDQAEGGELAHYYRFGEILHGRKLVRQSDGSWAYTGAEIPFPDCYPVAKVPPGGYPDVAAVQTFDADFATLLSQLEQAWSGGGDATLENAINTMFSLESDAGDIVTVELPGGGGNYGPDFIPGNAKTGTA
jgi:hypothetical protein